MKTQIQTPGFNARESLLGLISHKLLRVGKISDRILGAKIVLKIDKSDTRQNKICEIHLTIPGHDLFAKKEGESFEEAFQQVLNALEHQLLEWKSKSKIRNAKISESQEVI